MLVATDVHYLSDTLARAAAVVFEAWPSATVIAEYTHMATEFAPYEAGAFFRRELPCLVPVLRTAMEHHPVDTIIVDGYVDMPDHPGLGRHLHREFPDVLVVGVAKNRYPGAPAEEVVRAGAQPLFVSATAESVREAAEGVLTMDGPHRFPSLLLRVDHLARGI